MARSTAEIRADIELTRATIEAQLGALRSWMTGLAWTNYGLAGGALATGLALSWLPVLRVARMVRTWAQIVHAGANVAAALGAIRPFVGNRRGKAAVLTAGCDIGHGQSSAGPVSGESTRKDILGDSGSTRAQVTAEVESTVVDTSDRARSVAEQAASLTHEALERADRCVVAITGKPLGSWPERVHSVIRAHPLLSAAIAISVGYGLGTLMRRGRPLSGAARTSPSWSAPP